MKASLALALAALAPVASAYPWLAGAGAPPSQPEERDLISGIIGTVAGLLGSVAAGVNPSDKRPDAAHPFIAPGPTDQRGPCPALNVLANHGYLPRSGIVTAGQVIEATSEGFNMAADLSSLLVAIAVGTGGNIDTFTFSIGGEDNRTYTPTGVGSRAAGRQFGLDKHSACECDASATKQDFFLNDGDNHSGQGDRFARYVQLAVKNGGRFNLAASNQLYGQNAKLSLANNPRFYGGGYTLLVILGEYPFLPYFFSNGTYEAGGTANYESLSSILGFQLDKTTGKFCYVPERFPPNWYRRATPYGVAYQFIPQLFPTYAQQPLIAPPLSQFLGNPAEIPQLGCAIYQAVGSFVIASLVGSSVDRISAVETYIQNTLFPTIPSSFGCTLGSYNVTSPPVTEDSLQETRPGGGMAYNVCKA